MTQQSKKTTFIISAIIIIVFAIIFLSSAKLAKNEEKSNFKVNAITASNTKAPEGLAVSYTDTLQFFSPMSGKPANDTKITLTPINQRIAKSFASDYTNNELNKFYKVSPDGKYLAVLNTADGRNYGGAQTIDSTITVYDLSNGQSFELVKADSKTAILSFSWDWSSNAIGFITAKKPNFNSYDNPLTSLLPNEGNSGKMFLNRAELTTGKTSSKEYPKEQNRYYSYATDLIAVNDGTFYVLDHGNIITVGSDVKIQSADPDMDMGDQKVFISPDYKMVISASYLSFVAYDIEKKTKQVFNIGAGNVQSVRIQEIAISPDRSGIVFVKTSPEAKPPTSQLSPHSSSYDNSNSSRSTREVIWYYNFNDKQFKEISSQLITVNPDSYISTTTVAFSPGGNELAAMIAKSDNYGPISEQTLTIFDMKNSTSKSYPVSFTTDVARIINWQ